MRKGSAGSLSADVYLKIRSAVFDGTIQPGDRLQPALLSKQYGASTTVVREALAVLAGEKLVESKAGQGYFVPGIERDKLFDITSVRSHTEALALGWAMERGGVEWESQVIAAHHRMVGTPRRTDDGGLNPAWAPVHQKFHLQLIEGCGVPELIGMCEMLSSLTEVYRVWSSRLVPVTARDVEDEHAAIVEAILSGDVDAAADRLRRHYEKTAEVIVASWPAAVDPA